MIGTFTKFLNDGGIFMWVVLGVSIVALAIIIERTWVLNNLYAYSPAQNFFKGILRSMRGGDYAQAIRICGSSAHPLSLVLHRVLNYKDRSVEAIESVASLALQKVTPKLTKRTVYLQMLGNIATLFGLLGTIQGLIAAFTSLGSATAGAKAALLAQGISTAMNTTAFGLIVAIPCIVAYSILSNMENDILQNYEETLSEAVHILEHRKETVQQSHPGSLAPSSGAQTTLRLSEAREIK